MGAFYLDIKKDLLDKILSGVYQQGSIIPNEYELAEIYNVSRPTIRKAVQILVDEGYLEKRKKMLEKYFWGLIPKPLFVKKRADFLFKKTEKRI